jgi:hypothetical protein
LFELLLRHPGWKLYVGMLAQRKQELSDAILAPEMGRDAQVVTTGLKGEMRGILFAENQVALIIAGLRTVFAPEAEEE